MGELTIRDMDQGEEFADWFSELVLQYGEECGADGRRASVGVEFDGAAFARAEDFLECAECPLVGVGLARKHVEKDHRGRSGRGWDRGEKIAVHECPLEARVLR